MPDATTLSPVTPVARVSEIFEFHPIFYLPRIGVIRKFRWVRDPLLHFACFASFCSNQIFVHIINENINCSLIELSSPGRVLVELFRCSIVYLVDHSGSSTGYNQRSPRSICVSANIDECLRLSNIQSDQLIRDNFLCRRS